MTNIIWLHLGTTHSKRAHKHGTHIVQPTSQDHNDARGAQNARHHMDNYHAPVSNKASVPHKGMQQQAKDERTTAGAYPATCAS